MTERQCWAPMICRVETSSGFSWNPMPDAEQVTDNLRKGGLAENVPVNTLPLAIAAAWAYTTPEVFSMVMSRHGLKDSKTTFVEIVNDALLVCAKAFLLCKEDVAILCFRGTEPLNTINWAVDASVSLVPFHMNGGRSGGDVHSGFYRNVRAILPCVIDEMKKNGTKHLHITGHSYGGALAVLAAALFFDYRDKGDRGDIWKTLRSVCTFGQPKVGDKEFTRIHNEWASSLLHRFIYNYDIVPHLPPRIAGCDLVHMGTAYHAGAEGKWQQDQTLDAGAVEKLLAEVAVWAHGLPTVRFQAGALPSVRLPATIENHFPNHYIRTTMRTLGMERGSEFD